MTDQNLRLTDTHCHLNLPAFDEDLREVIERARLAGVERMLIPGVDVESSQRAVQLAETHDGLFAAVGVHPHYADSWDDNTSATLKALAASPKVIAIGEIGLDFYRNLSPRPRQIEVFRAQIALAEELGLPIVVHNREAIEDVLSILAEGVSSVSQDLAGRRGVLHAFSADRSSALRGIELGFYLGVAGPITFRKADDRREITRGLPLERLLIETDSPYLAPQPFRGKRNEPAYVKHVAEALSALFGLDLSEIAEYTSRSAVQLFRWDNGRKSRDIL